MAKTEYGTIRIPKDTYNRANEERQSNGETWEEFISRAIESNPTVELSESEVRTIAREEIESRVIEQALR